MNNQQAIEAGQRSDELIKNLANPSDAIVTDNTEVKVIDKAVPVEPTPTTQETAPVADPGNWEARFKGFKATTDITIHDLREEVRSFGSLKQENEALKQKLEEMKAQIPEVPNEMSELFSDDEVKGFNKLLDGKVGGLESEVDRLKGELSRVQEVEAEAVQANAHQQVVDAVAAAVPNYREIDYDPKFATFMNEPDNFGNIRKDILIRAKTATPPDIGRIVQFYVEFSGMKPAQEEQQVYTQQELLQTPSSTPSAGTEVPQGSKITWDAPTIQLFYKDKATGKISAEQAKVLEADLYASQKRG